MRKRTRSQPPPHGAAQHVTYEDTRMRLIGLGILGGLVVAALFIGLLVYAVNSMDETILRWWAALVTLALAPLWLMGYLQGKADSHALKDGIQTGVGAVMSAANATADLRVRTAQAMRTQKPLPAGGAAFNIYLPNQPGLGAPPAGYASLLPPVDADTVELV